MPGCQARADTRASAAGTRAAPRAFQACSRRRRSRCLRGSARWSAGRAWFQGAGPRSVGPPWSRGAVLVEVAGADDCEPRAVEIDVAPAEACRLGRSHPGLEERVHVGMVRRVRSHAKLLLRHLGPGAELSLTESC